MFPLVYFPPSHLRCLRHQHLSPGACHQEAAAPYHLTVWGSVPRTMVAGGMDKRRKVGCLGGPFGGNDGCADKASSYSGDRGR